MLSRLSKNARQPTAALLVTTVVGAALFLLSNVATNIYTLMVNFTTGSFYLAFLFPLFGASSCSCGDAGSRVRSASAGWRLPVTVVAVVWAAVEFVNISWPRTVYPQTLARLVGVDRHRGPRRGRHRRLRVRAQEHHGSVDHQARPRDDGEDEPSDDAGGDDGGAVHRASRS